MCDGVAVATELRRKGQVAFEASDSRRGGDEADESLAIGEDDFDELTLFESDAEQTAPGCFVALCPAVEGVFLRDSCIDDRWGQESKDCNGGIQRSPGRCLEAPPKIADARERSSRSEDRLGGTDKEPCDGEEQEPCYGRLEEYAVVRLGLVGVLVQVGADENPVASENWKQR